MSSAIRLLGTGSQAASYVLGGLAVAAAAASAIFATSASEIASWTFDVLGIGYVALLVGLVYLSIFSLIRMTSATESDRTHNLWLQVGLQSASGVATLALTFTLLGISLGIGGLAGQPLTPETVQPVIRDLTANFSLAFMTTVVGLPVSAALRAILLIAHEKRQSEGFVQ